MLLMVVIIYARYTINFTCLVYSQKRSRSNRRSEGSFRSSVRQEIIYQTHGLLLLHLGSMFLMRHLHLTWSCSSSLDSSLSDNLLLMLPNHHRFRLPLLLFPDTSIPITLLPTYSSSLLNTWPNATSPTYFPALSWIFPPPLLSL